MLTTDKPIYQPGQLMHLRVLALARGANLPLANAPVTFEIEDGKGNKIFKKSGETDSYGICSTQFRLGSVLNLGDFKVRVDASGQVTEKTVSVLRTMLCQSSRSPCRPTRPGTARAINCLVPSTPTTSSASPFLAAT